MKKIILLRHGKAADHWGDFERPLSTKGREEVRSVSSKLLDYGDALPQCVICSEALRTKQTLEVFSEVYAKNSFDTEYVQTLYHGDLSDVLASISKTRDSVDNLMIVGHNPILSELASQLSRKHTSLSTANAAILTCTSSNQSWNDIVSKEWKLERVCLPN